MSMSVITYALVALLVFFLLVGKFAKCCYHCFGDNTTLPTPPYYVYPNPMPIRNAASERNSPCPNYANAAATSTIAAGQTHTRNTTSQRSPCPTYDNAAATSTIAAGQTHTTNTTSQRSPCPTYDNVVATTMIAVGQPLYDFASPRSDLRYPTFNGFALTPPPPSYYEDPPPSYDQVCGVTSSINEHQSRQI